MNKVPIRACFLPRLQNTQELAPLFIRWVTSLYSRAQKSQRSVLTTGITGQKTCIFRTDEKYDATWHHFAGKG
jgi:hypothetical protein